VRGAVTTRVDLTFFVVFVILFLRSMMSCSSSMRAWSSFFAARSASRDLAGLVRKVGLSISREVSMVEDIFGSFSIGVESVVEYSIVANMLD
jgi:hypothetical protein